MSTVELAEAEVIPLHIFIATVGSKLSVLFYLLRMQTDMLPTVAGCLYL